MAHSGASSHWLRSTNTVSVGSNVNPFLNAYSIHCWVRSSVAPNQGSVRAAMNIMGDGFTGPNNQNPETTLYWDHTGAGFPKSAVQRRADQSYDKAALTSSPSIDTWYAFGQSFDGSNLKVWFGGTNETTAASAASQNKSVWMAALAESLSDGTIQSQFSNGQIAEVAFWTAALNADEFNALAKGFRPTRIRPASLFAYLPLVRATIDLRGTPWNEMNSPTVTDHPRVLG
ncbi:hypothetical protein EH240_20085 [Mesorhizobium tamadayense]|uniref:LamG domain-containing protein n=1 Tax=Mesorhizobium tamadayense TaxID=425306 RepID=A0A3P3FIH3_9HYPH|nr:LamG-like jellyroll fold domain-containing protein [Mesorhizobium tamadayense]RRH98097.1 hypothetical protein EH240_20085 [Mesorhizobium tamadayense]